MPSDPPEAWNGYAGLDKKLEHRARLAICVLLSRHTDLSFRRLRELLEETDGNLGAHLRKLEDVGYVAVRKEFVERKPVSWYTLTQAGQAALEAHVDGLQALLALRVDEPGA